MTMPLLPLTAAFFVGRLVSYSIYVGVASLARHSIGSVLVDSLTSPVGIAIQVVALVAIVLLVRVDWARVLTRHGHSEPRPPAQP
jgi:hypothetical protein